MYRKPGRDRRHPVEPRQTRHVRRRRRAAARLLRRQRGLPLPRAGLRGAPVRARRRARRRLAADRLRRARLRAVAPAVAGARARSTATAGACSLAWGAVLAVMNCCFYLAIDRLPLGTVAAIEFLPVIALAALGARSARNVGRARARRRRRVPAHRRAPGGRAARRRARVRQRRPLRRSTSCSPTAWRATARSAGSTASPRRCSSPRSSSRRSPAGRWCRRSAIRSRCSPASASGISSSVIPYVVDQLAMARLPRATYALMVVAAARHRDGHRDRRARADPVARRGGRRGARHRGRRGPPRAGRGRRRVRRRRPALAPRQLAAAGSGSTNCAVVVEVDDDVQHGLVEAHAGARDEVAREPVRALLGVRGDDDLVGREGPQRVLDGLQRIAVADVAVGDDPRGAQATQRRLEPPFAAARAASLSDIQCRSREFSAGATTSTRPPTLRARKRIASCRTVPSTVSLAMTRIRREPGPASRCCDAAMASPRGRRR